MHGLATSITVSLVLAITLATGGLAHGPLAQEDRHYLAANGPVVVWCSAGGHGYLPDGLPDGEADAWLFSGSPECAPGDLLFGTEHDHGLAGAGFCIGGAWGDRPCGDHTGDLFRADAADGLHGARPPLTLSIAGSDASGQPNGLHAFGCGHVEGTIPADDGPSVPTTGPRLAWVRVANLHVDAGSGDVCLGTEGTLTATY